MWREPREETVGLYPGLVVSDGRVAGSITVGPTRLPLWAFVGWAIQDGFEVAAADYYNDADYEEFAKRDLANFLTHLLDLRGEFARLLLVLADEERRDEAKAGRVWWQTKRHRKRVADQLRRCLAVLEEGDQ